MEQQGISAYMDEASRLALEALDSGSGGPFGAVIVRDGQIIGRGRNESFSLIDPTAHAEVQAIRDACAKTGSLELAGAVMYSSAEPCPMCMAAIYWAVLDGVYFANTKEASAQCGFDDARIYSELRQDWTARKMNMVHLPNAIAHDSFERYRDQVAAKAKAE